MWSIGRPILIKRGTAEELIIAGKQAVKMTLLSCHHSMASALPARCG
jgi:hypothetical protein